MGVMVIVAVVLGGQRVGIKRCLKNKNKTKNQHSKNKTKNNPGVLLLEESLSRKKYLT